VKETLGKGPERDAGEPNSDAAGYPAGIENRILNDGSSDPIRFDARYAQATVTVDPSALTGHEDIDQATQRLANRLKSVLDFVGPGSGPLYGIMVHEVLKGSLRVYPIEGIKVGDVEPSFGGGYGAKDSIRPDIVFRPGLDVRAIYDWKTGGAVIGAARAEELRAAVGVGRSVPVIQMSLSRGIAIKSNRIFAAWRLGL